MNYNAHPKMKNLYIGVDCHKYIHVATIINCFNEKINTITFNNDKQGYEYLIKTVEECKSDLIPIYGLEDSKHLGYGLAFYLLTHKQKVKHVNSNLTYAERKKNPIITKNDELDSACVAKVLLDELDNLPDVQNDEIYWTLKQLVNMRTIMVKNNIKIKNRLHAQLMHHYPNYNKIFSNIDCSTALNFWETYPSPKQLLEEDIEVLTANLKTWSKGKQGIKKAEMILDIIKEYDDSANEYQASRNFIIQTLVKEIKENNKKLVEMETKVLDIYDTIGCKLHSYPCLSKITSAELLSEIGNINRFKNSGCLAKYAGIAPIERSSGGKEKDLNNEYGNRQLNSMFYKLACRSICAGSTGNTPFNPIFKEYYQKKINQGKTKHQALICIMRRTCNIVYKILKDNVEYQSPEQLIEECINLFRERKKIEEEKKKQKEMKKKKHQKNAATQSVS